MLQPIFDNCWFVWCLCSVFTMKVETSCWLFYFRSGKSLFSIYRVLSLPPTSRYFHRMCKTYLLMNGWQKCSGFTRIYTVRGPVSTNLAYQLTLTSPITVMPIHISMKCLVETAEFIMTKKWQQLTPGSTIEYIIMFKIQDF